MVRFHRHASGFLKRERLVLCLHYKREETGKTLGVTWLLSDAPHISAIKCLQELSIVEYSQFLFVHKFH